MEIKTNNKLNPSDGQGIRFGVVVTLKEMNGINRIDEFILGRAEISHLGECILALFLLE